MQSTNFWPIYSSLPLDAPILLCFRRGPHSAPTYGTAISTSQPRNEGSSSFLRYEDNGWVKTFLDAETRVSWAEIIQVPSDEEPHTEVLSAASLGITQLPLSRFIDNMAGMYFGSKRTFRMRTQYGAQTWFGSAGECGTTVLECQYPQVDDTFSIASLFLQGLPPSAHETPPEVFQPPHFDADADFHARWPFAFTLKATYHAADNFILEIILSGLSSDVDITRALVHAAVVAVFVMKDNIYMTKNSHESVPQLHNAS